LGSDHSTELNISLTLANASTGRPSFSSKPDKFSATMDAAASISEKRIFTQRIESMLKDGEEKNSTRNAK
jgi:hypothetical protein